MKKQLSKKCFVCCKSVKNKNLNKDGHYFCSNDCEAEYWHITDNKLFGEEEAVKMTEELIKTEKLWVKFEKALKKQFSKDDVDLVSEVVGAGLAAKEDWFSDANISPCNETHLKKMKIKLNKLKEKKAKK